MVQIRELLMDGHEQFTDEVFEVLESFDGFYDFFNDLRLLEKIRLVRELDTIIKALANK